MARLGDYIKQIRGVSYKPEDLHSSLDDNSIILLRTNNIQDGKLVLDDVVFVDKSKVRAEQLLKQGDILICTSSGSKELVGKAAFVEADMNVTFGAFCKVVRPVMGHPRYLGHYFNSAVYRKQISALSAGANINNIRNEHIDSLEIHMPSFDKQISRSDSLNKIDKLISLRKKQLQKLDDLVKSRFVEMFGDPIINQNNHEIKRISELFDVGSSKRVFESEWRDSGVPFYRAREIVKLSRDGYVDNELFIEESMYEDYKKKYGVPKENDMMVTGVGTLGVCYIVKGTDKFYFKDGNILWFKNKGLCDVRFIKDQFETDYVKDQITANANVSTVGTYTITNANNTMVLVPPIDDQHEYVAYCNNIDKLKAKIQQGLDKLEQMNQALMQKYFG